MHLDFVRQPDACFVSPSSSLCQTVHLDLFAILMLASCEPPTVCAKQCTWICLQILTLASCQPPNSLCQTELCSRGTLAGESGVSTPQSTSQVVPRHQQSPIFQAPCATLSCRISAQVINSRCAIAGSWSMQSRHSRLLLMILLCALKSSRRPMASWLQRSRSARTKTPSLPS